MTATATLWVVIETGGRASDDDKVIYRTHFERDAERYADVCRGAWPHLEYRVEEREA